MPTLSNFIGDNTEQILSEWETFARSLPMGDSMDIVALRDHAREMLRCIAHDLETPQTSREAADKAKGKTDADGVQAPTAAQEHGAGRAGSGFTVAQMVAEFRALRASVIRLWTSQQGEVGVADLEDMTRFNEAIDQSIAESITRYTADIGESKERFLAILGHDLRTPLGAIMTSARFMLDTGALGEPYLSLVARIASSAGRMNQMVADLLDFTRTRFGDGIPIARAEMDVRKMVHDVVSEVTASSPSSTVQIESSGELRGQWDSDRLKQALTNLVGNAVQHGSSKSPIKVSARGAPDEVVISVHNDGPIIPKEQLGEIFQAMKQAKADGARDSHLGLGLYIVDRIVTAHGGSVAVRSSEEQGTTFTVRLPRVV
jgi:signal transduction histidine kinase